MRFRVYDKVDRKYYYPNKAGMRFKLDSCGNLIMPNGQVADNSHIIQFSSGVLDKNRVEIYDGDTVKYSIGEEKNIDLIQYDPEQLMWVMNGTAENSGRVLQFVKYLDYIIVNSV